MSEPEKCPTCGTHVRENNIHTPIGPGRGLPWYYSKAFLIESGEDPADYDECHDPFHLPTAPPALPSEPEKVPEWAREEAGRIALSSEDRDPDIIADTAERSLMEAYARGREDAAKVVDGWHIRKGGYTALAAAIRAGGE